MKPPIDPLLLLLVTGLLLTTGLFMAGVFPYPFGILILVLLIVSRLLWKT